MSSKDDKIQADALLSDRWNRHADALQRSLPAALDGDNAVDLRKAVEALGRLRTWIGTWDPLVDDPRLGAVDIRLHTAQVALVRVGDVDAIGATVVRAAERVAFAQLATSSLQRELVHRRHSAHVQALTTIDPSELLEDVEMINGTIQFRPEAEKRAVRVLPPLAKVQWRNLLREVEALASPPAPKRLYPVGVAAARAGNSALDLAVAVGKPARRYAKAMTRLHDHLQDLDDAVRTADFLDHRGRVGGPTSATNAGLLRGITLTTVADGLDRWPQWWAHANQKKLRTWW
jgi:hypothetical protein